MIRLMSSCAAIALIAAACSPAEQAPVDQPDTAVETPPAPETVTDELQAETAPVAEPVDIETIGYPEGWEMQPYWSGEYPRAFAVTQEGVINYDAKGLFLCTGFSDAEYCTTTEVYPDSPRTSPAECVEAQVAAVRGGLDHLKVKAH